MGYKRLDLYFWSQTYNAHFQIAGCTETDWQVIEKEI